MPRSVAHVFESCEVHGRHSTIDLIAWLWQGGLGPNLTERSKLALAARSFDSLIAIACRF